MKKKWLIVISCLILLAGGGGSLYYFIWEKSASAQTAETSEAALQTAVARLGELVVTASGTGQVVARAELSLGFDESGALIELSASPGQKVKAGDVLARLQTKYTAEEIAATISEAELAVIKAQQALDSLYTSSEASRTAAMNDIAAYSQAVRDAQYTLDNFTIPPFLQGMDAIEALDRMKAELDAANAAFEPYRFAESGNVTRRKLLAALYYAQSNYDTAVKRLNYEYALQVAEANLAKARLEYEKYKNGPSADELALAEATLASAKASLALAKKKKPVIDLTAPIDGTIMDVTAAVGEELSAGPFIVLADLSRRVLDVYLDETDLDKVGLGCSAEVVFDAIPDKTFYGSVSEIYPSLETVSNVKAIRARVQLEDTSQTVSLPVGLNATVDIIAGKAENAVLIPVEALRKLDEGEYAVFVVVNDKLLMRVVQVGLIDVTTAQILSGLQAGEVVSTGIVEAE